MQTTNSILLVRPANFTFNTDTAASNYFQHKVTESAEISREKAIAEFDAFAATLRQKGINTFIFDDTPSPVKPDAIFPNNWATFHPDGSIILYPMHAPNRRLERRPDIIDALRSSFRVTEIIDLSSCEEENKFLEGTGSIVFDHDHKVAYGCLSPRTDRELFIEVCDRLGYSPLYFYSHDKAGNEIYHTNVMMCVASRFAVICLESITDKRERDDVIRSLTGTGHKIIDITFGQVSAFAGNMLALHTNDDKEILAMSQSAYDSLTPAQKAEIERYSELVPLPITTIETIGGGSARCMIAELFLPPL